MRHWGLVAAVGVAALGVTIAAWKVAVFTLFVSDELARASSRALIAPRPQATVVFDRHGRQVFTFFVERRIDVTLDRVSPHMVNAILAIEDRRFYRHRGVDPIRIAGAAWKNLRAGRIVEGGSTITQQLARAVQLSPVRTYERKIREIVVATELERRYTKAQILEEYLNTVYFGQGHYGVEAAARGYFGKPASELDIAEAALLSALVRSPSYDSPRVSPQRALKRRNLVLAQMHRQGRISNVDLQPAMASALPAGPPEPEATKAPGAPAAAAAGLYFEEEVRRRLFDLFGADRVLRGGLRVYSTYDPELQHEAERAVALRIGELARSRRGADLQAALVSMDPASGDVYALVGGRDFRESSFNRATQARRQAGSAFKPIVYAAALERGYAPGTLLRGLDLPIASAEGDWLPGGGHERSEYTVRNSLKVSSNRAAAQLLQHVGVTTAVHYARRLGVTSDLPHVPSLALGTGEVTLLELTAAYSAFASHGMVAAPRLILRVQDASGTTIWEEGPRRSQAVSRRTAYLMSSMLSDVISSGTAARARAAGFTLPAGAKTGTTDDYADAWFIGYTPSLLTGVWFGLDRPAPIMREGFGGTVAAPVWARFMRAATRGAKPQWYRMPADVEQVTVCRISGQRAGAACRHAPVLAGRAATAGGAALLPAGLAVTRPAVAEPDADDADQHEPAVYKDLFPAGAIPPSLCELHGPESITALRTGIRDGTVRLSSSSRLASGPFSGGAAGQANRDGRPPLGAVLLNVYSR